MPAFLFFILKSISRLKNDNVAFFSTVFLYGLFVRNNSIIRLLLSLLPSPSLFLLFIEIESLSEIISVSMLVKSGDYILAH